MGDKPSASMKVPKSRHLPCYAARRLLEDRLPVAFQPLPGRSRLQQKRIHPVEEPSKGKLSRLPFWTMLSIILPANGRTGHVSASHLLWGTCSCTDPLHSGTTIGGRH